MRDAVKTKIDFYERWAKGEFGNRLRVWNSIAEIDPSYTGPIGIRNKVPGGRWCRYAIPQKDLEKVRQEFINDGAPASTMTYGEMAPDDKMTLQGELIQTECGLRLHYSLAKRLMRDALRERSFYVEGIRVYHLLRTYCDGSSYDDLMDLLDNYPGHAIEFSCYTHRLGTCNRNTIIWEVRDY